MPNLREISKQEFNSVRGTNEEIYTGALQRIADATELMAQNYVRMEMDLKYYKAQFQLKNKEIEILNKKIAAYKGVITKLKKNK